ncbi:MAG TPA: HEPN domain-containing protein [Pirellulaceae bacterium]|nr:HEPN domain-containing protein [Pirellulaceae bacterium]
MQFIADHYYRAALERIEDARLLYSQERFAFSMYVSGLAVEGLLRAFYWRKNPVFDARHDLAQLFKESGIAGAEEQRLTRRGLDSIEITKALTELFAARDTVARLWSNDYRFAPESQVRARLRALGERQNKRGNQVKPSALALYNSAKLLIDRSTVIWTSGKK